MEQVMAYPSPRVSVVLPVYNGAAYLEEAIQSILTQSFEDFELIVINDGSTDSTESILNALVDPRVRVIHQKNQGLALTLNHGIALARGEYIARQEADDISLPERFALQVAYLDQHPDCALLGSWSTIWEDRQATKRGHQHPSENGELQIRLLFDSFFVHSSVMLRRSALQTSGVYSTDPERNPPEDFDLWLRIARHFKVANLPIPLLVYREVPSSISRVKADLLQSRAIGIACENLQKQLALDASEKNLRDLIACLRHLPERLSSTPDWRSLMQLLSCIAMQLQSRWPEDAESIRKGQNDLKRILLCMRCRLSRFGNWVCRCKSWLCRVLGTISSR